jgi:hypothetical protein
MPLGLASRGRGNSIRMEERRGTRSDRLARLAGRGREETTPVALQLGVAGVAGLLVAVILAVSLVLWLLLR